VTTPSDDALDRSRLSRRALLATASVTAVGAGVSRPVPGSESWTLMLGGRERYLFRDVALDGPTGYLGGVAPTGDGTAAWVVRIYEGRPTWLNTYGDGRDSRATTVVPAPDGGVIVAGATVASGTDTERGWVFALDADGTMRWEQAFSGTNGVARSLSLTPDGEILAAGRVESGLTGIEGWVARLRPGGAVRWVRTYGRDLKVAFNAVAHVGGSPVVAGLASPRGDRGDGFLARVATRGGLRDRRRYDLDGLATGVTAIAPGPDGAVVGGTREGPRDHFDVWAASIDGDGTRRWTETYGRSRRDRLADAARTPDGGALLAGRTDERSGSAREGWVLKVGADGDREWTRTFGGSGDDRLDGVAVGESEYVVAGKRTTRADGPQGWATRRSLDDDSGSSSLESIPSAGIVGSLAAVVVGVGLGVLRRRSRRE